MKKFIYLFFLLSSGMLFTSMLNAQVYTLTGKVLDKASGSIARRQYLFARN